MKVIKDWNRNEITPIKDVFHFKNSLRPFIFAENTQDESIFIDINENRAYSYEELEYEGLFFYTDETEKDLDFMGVEFAGNIKEWF